MTYDLATLDAARTHDDVWNAAQRELVRTGHMHNYLRMLWGKKVLEWSRTPEAAFETLVHLNNRYALDGRDPNSYAGILWTFGLHDRPWAPERPIFGTIRYMSSANTKKKLALKGYLASHGDGSVQGDLGGSRSRRRRPRRVRRAVVRRGPPAWRRRARALRLRTFACSARRALVPGDTRTSTSSTSSRSARKRLSACERSRVHRTWSGTSRWT